MGGAEPLDLVSEPWPSVSDAAKELIQGMLTVDPTKRMTIEDVLQHPWLADPSVAPKTALDNIVYKRFKNFAAMSKFKELDKDKSGTVSIDELREGLKLQSSDAAAELEEIFKVVDLDGTGEIHWEEFIVATLARRSVNLKPRSSARLITSTPTTTVPSPPRNSKARSTRCPPSSARISATSPSSSPPLTPTATASSTLKSS